MCIPLEPFTNFYNIWGNKIKITHDEDGGLSTWVILVIVFAGIIFITIIILLIVFCCCTGDRTGCCYHCCPRCALCCCPRRYGLGNVGNVTASYGSGMKVVVQ